ELPAKNDLKTTVFHIYGKNIAKFMEPFNYVEEDSLIKIKGLLGHPQISKKNRNYSSLFINNRYVISDVLFRAIKEAYEGTLMISKYPFFVIFLDLNPSVVDFNVHPKKLHVRFEKEDFLYNRVYNIIRSFVESNFIKNEAKYISTELDPYIQTNKQELAKEGKKFDEIQDIEENPSKPVKLIKREIEKIEESVQLNLMDQVIKKKDGSESYLRGKYIISKNFPKIR
ncbi:unnamed protein product, partial [marine sediment metagenome]